MLYYIQGYLIVFLEVLCCKMFFESFCKVDVGRKKYKTFVLFIVLVSLDFTLSIFLQDFFIPKELAVIGVTTIVMRWYYAESIKKHLVLAIIYQSIVLIADYITLILYENIYSDLYTITDMQQSLILVMAKSVIFLLIVLIKHFFCKREMEYLSESQWMKFLIFPLFSIFVIATLISGVSHDLVGSQEELTWLIAFGLVGMNVVVFNLISDVATKDKRIYEKELFEVYAKNQLKLYEKNLEEAEREKKITHEYRNQIECIQMLFETRRYLELKDYLYKVTGRIQYDLERINTNHAIINAILNAKYREAVDKGIVFVFKINDMSKIYMDSQDIVVILSNLLDNAIEACEKCSGDKIIKFKLVHEGENLILAVKNTYNGEIKYDNDFIITTKKDNSRKHGIGLSNMIHVVKQNYGWYVIEPTEQEFYISIMIPQESSIH